MMRKCGDRESERRHMMQIMQVVFSIFSTRIVLCTFDSLLIGVWSHKRNERSLVVDGEMSCSFLSLP